MSRKAPPPKKRHTKPCKFFQVDQCPYPADLCNFAHVIAPPSDRGSSIYHYYPAGYYAQDALCRYRYRPKVPLLKPLDISTSADSHPQVDLMNLEKAYLVRDTLSIPDVPSIRRGRPSSDLSPKTAAESPLLSSFIHSPESITTGSTSMSASDLDEVVIVTDDPQYHEHLHSYQSQVYVEDDSPVIHVPPFSPFYQVAFNGPHSPLYGYDHSYMYGRSLYPSKPRSGTRSLTKQKILKYKTKPCRFFPTERGCPKGSSCTFIHDDLRHQAPSPVKESNSKEENSRKNYFPVSWRVIGGGVRVAVKTDDADPYTTATGGPTSKLDKSIPSTRVASRKRSNSNPPTPSPHSQQFKIEHLFSAESPGVL
ncbi:hypothetical protein BYT27DRAFT_7202627 [Phlegmacium glaucopus]|nr:hypothetical protein BYT27DRAFT_7202627 [Phlegmacium glaucopus]